MGREADIEPISALDKQIAEKEAEIVQLKRLRNSLLTVGCIPPEILGYVFAISADLELPWTWDSRFAGIQKDPDNFLLVCHHWYEVANHTPEVWISWGNSLGDRGSSATFDLKIFRSTSCCKEIARPSFLTKP